LANGFSISPLDLPLKPDLFIAKPEPIPCQMVKMCRRPINQ